MALNGRRGRWDVCKTSMQGVQKSLNAAPRQERTWEVTGRVSVSHLTVLSHSSQHTLLGPTGLCKNRIISAFRFLSREAHILFLF